MSLWTWFLGGKSQAHAGHLSPSESQRLQARELAWSLYQ